MHWKGGCVPEYLLLQRELRGSRNSHRSFVLKTDEICWVRSTESILLLASLEADGTSLVIAQEQRFPFAKGAHALDLGLTQLKHLLHERQTRQFLCHDNTGGAVAWDRTLQEHFGVLGNATDG